MAFQLTVDITDAQQARILDLASRHAPNATLPQLRTRLEKAARMGVRNELTGWVREVTDADWAVARAAEDVALETDFPDEDADDIAPIDDTPPSSPLENP